MTDTAVNPGPHVFGEATLLSMSYVDNNGHAVGFGAATPTEDLMRMLAVRDAVDMWSAVISTRRVLLAYPLSAVTAAADRIALVATRVREFAGRGDTVLVVGRAGSAAEGMLAQAPDVTALVTSVTQARTVNALDSGQVSFVVVPGIPIEDAADIVAKLRERFPLLRGQNLGEFCYAASDQREAVRSVTAASDLLLVCDPDGDPGTRVLGQSIGAGKHGVRWVARTGQIRAEWLAGVVTVGLVSASAGGERLTWEVVTALSGLGPLAVAARSVNTDHLDHAVSGWTEALSDTDSQVVTTG